MMASTADVARLLDCTQRHVRRLVAGGLIPARRLGRDWFVAEEWAAEVAALPPAVRRERYFRRPRGGRNATTWPRRGEPCARCGAAGTGGPCRGC